MHRTLSLRAATEPLAARVNEPATMPTGDARCRIIVMAKAPLAGYAKTRLIPALGAHGAAALAERLLAHALAQAQAAALGPVELRCAPDAAHPAWRRLAQGARLADQDEGDLGQRMARAFDAAFSDGERCVLLVGTDAPGLTAEVLRRAAAALHGEADAVFVPALDGGYALVGLRRPAPVLFEGMTWSCGTVMQRTRERLAAAGMRHAELPPLADIDEPADLAHLPAGWLPLLPEEI